MSDTLVSDPIAPALAALAESTVPPLAWHTLCSSLHLLPTCSLPTCTTVFSCQHACLGFCWNLQLYPNSGQCPVARVHEDLDLGHATAENIANMGVCHSAGVQAVVGETQVYLWQTGEHPDELCHP